MELAHKVAYFAM